MSDDGRKYAYVSGAGFAQAENKKKYFAEYLASSGVKEDWVTASLPLFNYWSQAELTVAYLEAGARSAAAVEARTEDFLRGELAGQLRRKPAFARQRCRRVDRFLRRESRRSGSALEDSRSRDELDAHGADPAHSIR